MIVRPFPVFEHYWDPNTVITLADDQDGTLVVNLLLFFCFSPVCYKAKVITARKAAQSLVKRCLTGQTLERGAESFE